MPPGTDGARGEAAPRHASRTAALELAVVSLGYALVTAIVTWPAAASLSTAILGDGGDALQMIWNLSWVRKAVLGQVPLFFTHDLFSPGGVDLRAHTLTPLNGVLAIPLGAFLSPEATYDVLVLSAFVTSGVGAYYLARHVSGDRRAAFAGGIVFCACAFRTGHALGHLNLVSTAAVPLFVLLVLRVVERGLVRDAALAGLCLALAAASDPWVFTFAVLAGAPLALHAFVDAGLPLSARRRPLVVLAATAGVAAAPLLAPLVAAIASGELLPGHDPATWSADVAGYLLPGELSTFASLAELVRPRPPQESAAEHSLYLGVTAMALAAYAWKTVPRARIWAHLGCGFLVLSLGPTLRVAGVATRIPLPFALIAHLPGASIVGTPVRLSLLVFLCQSVLVSLAIARGLARPWTWAVASGLLVVESLAVPFPVRAEPVAAFYRSMAADGERYAVLDVGDRPTLPMYLATIHGKPIPGGDVARLAASKLAEGALHPVTFALVHDRPLPGGVDLPAAIRRECDALGIRYLLAHDPERAELVRRDLRLPLVATDVSFWAYRCAGGSGGAPGG